MYRNSMIKRAISRRSLCLALGIATAASVAAGAVFAAGNATAGSGAPSYPGIIGDFRTYTAKHEDTFADLARRFRLGFTELVAANPGVDPWVPGDGTEIVLPTWHIVPDAPRDGILINLADQRLYYFRERGLVETAPLGIGDDGWHTPTGTTRVVRKKANPAWYVPKSIRAENPELPTVVPAGPRNPLGAHAIYLGWPSYLLHGTNKPDGVGRRVSHGCIRMYPEDIAHFFQQVPIGTSVRVIDETVKVARFAGRLWLEVVPNQDQADELEMTGKLTPAVPPAFERKLILAAGDLDADIDWETAYKVASERRGYPVAITPAPPVNAEAVPMSSQAAAGETD
jgi:L,D-transpeptidase ErfK/SrfK